MWVMGHSLRGSLPGGGRQTPLSRDNYHFKLHRLPPTPFFSPHRTTTCASSSQTQAHEMIVPKMIEFLKEDLKHLFDDEGIDRSKYEDNVEFLDPITKYNSIQGYLLNIQFLRRVFAPEFSLLDIKQTGPYEITTRWAMVMNPTFVARAIQPLWNPVLKFTGTSRMGINPATGKFNSHVDTWDAISQQDYFSFEAFAHMLTQIFDPKKVPLGLETPPSSIVLKKPKYEVRKYESFIVAEVSPSMNGSAAFGTLAGYIFGKNQGGQRMAMTTPVISTPEKMQFYMGTKASSTGDLPAPNDPGVELKEIAGGLWAVISFGGFGDEATAAAKADELTRLAVADGLPVDAGKKWLLARYNDPGTLPPFRTNEVLLPLNAAEFKLW